MTPDSAPSFSAPKTVRPFGSAYLCGITFNHHFILAIDPVQGYLLQIDPRNDNTIILNPHHVDDFRDVTGLALSEDKLWVTRGDSVYWCTLTDLSLQHFLSLPYPADGIAVRESTLYITCQKAGKIFIFSRDTGREITRFYAPGVGIENVTVRDEELWVCDRLEQTVYCLDRATGEINFSILTPFENPTGLAFDTDADTGKPLLYVAYSSEEAYLRDNPNANPNYELAFRDRAFIHPLYFQYYRDRRYALSNGYLVEMSYVEELSPLEQVELTDVEWRIALPVDTDRQKVRSVEPVGLPFIEAVEDGQRVAVFKFPTLKPNERRIFGWKALLEVWSIKYQFMPRDLENLPELEPEFQSRYLVDDDELAMNTEIIRDAARDAIGTETNLLRKMYNIRNYVYDRLSYGIKPHIDTPDLVLARGVGSCGEYLGVLLALARLNGIACRTVGRYKCPLHPDKRGIPLQPDFNHVWMEFYVPGIGWLPMESNPDDVNERGPYPSRFFMGLAWYHAEIAKSIPFETLTSQGAPVKKQDISIGDLALNHVRFTILEELAPPNDCS